MADRRDFLIAALVGGTGAKVAAGQEIPSAKAPSFAGIRDLGLSPEGLADIEAFAESVLRDVASLADLPLEGLDPAFVFIPRG